MHNVYPRKARIRLSLNRSVRSSRFLLFLLADQVIKNHRPSGANVTFKVTRIKFSIVRIKYNYKDEKFVCEDLRLSQDAANFTLQFLQSIRRARQICEMQLAKSKTR